MNLGFETVGNATLIAYDGRPVLATDPWIAGAPYFGSWGMSHEIPEAQLAAIRGADYIWFSHGHPDHLNGESLERLRDRRILIPTHVGGRIRADLEAQGYAVRELPSAQWVRLSARIRVMCLPDYNQDAVLLVEIGDALLINANDASALGWMPLVRRIVRGYRRSFLLALTGFGDADMINFFDEAGRRIAPPPLLRKRSGRPLGRSIARLAESYGASYFVPFSSMHRFQREDSAWANECSTPVEAHAEGFHSRRCRILPAFVRYDLEADRAEAINPPPAGARLLPPEAFGDHWSEPLEADERALAERYFRSFAHLAQVLDFVNLRVGGRDNVIPLGKGRKRGVTFEAPRHSLVTSIRYEIFDDLLIGNFMKTVLHGKWPASGLYPDFSPYVAKYGDNGRARTRAELRAYFAAYRRQIGLIAFLRHRFSTRASAFIRSSIPFDSLPWRIARRTYWLLRPQA